MFRPVRAEEDEARLAASRLLVAGHRLPRPLPVYADGLWPQHLLDHPRVAAREAQGREKAGRDGPAVRQALVTGRGLERVREGVPEVQERALAALVRIAQADRRLVGDRAADELVVGQLPERLAREKARLHDL